MNPDLSWILNDVLQVPGAQHAILVSADGLLLASSDGIGRDDAETVAAAMSSMQSLSRAVAPFVGNGPRPWKQTLIEYDGGWIFLISRRQRCLSRRAAALRWTWRPCRSVCSSRWGPREGDDSPRPPECR